MQGIAMVGAQDLIARAEALAGVFALTAAQRDALGGTPWHERQLLRESGLLLLTVPEVYGGLGQSWPTFFEMVRVIARADSSLAHLFAYHHLQVITPHLLGTPEQCAHYYAQTVQQGWFWGNALNPLDRRMTATRTDAGWQLNGLKNFCSGATGSEVLVVSALRPDTGALLVGVIPTEREGITILNDWNNMGQRQTDSGSIAFSGVLLRDEEILGPPGPLGSTFASLRSCFAQLILANIFLGTAQGALATARTYTLNSAMKPSAPTVLHRYGTMWVDLQAAQLVTDQAARHLQTAWDRGDELTPQERGEHALTIASAKVLTSKVALDITAQVFEVMGARATDSKFRFDRYWRNVRTLTLHDSVDAKVHELGDWALNHELPTPSFYS
ncbi:acyl-CoA dehydrogenase family protein [Anthocerotibacter panamensis]|uniref:acyl-CoA dehydrogenase family protein n=1 Tax=Anthocerotibacter panamensis TaxID=2857077 RepID=UPI001C4057B8|nr:acyl-CoA dehydrogenase family protein [Anthocerotibacter panamensis]